jgi:hypothetical protein
MRNFLHFLLVVLLLAVVHEGAHALTARLYGEYEALHARPFGLEVTYVTPVAERQGLQWAIIAGSGNALTILIGYALFVGRRRIASIPNLHVRGFGYWSTVLFLLVDPLNLAIGPFLYGGDAGGIAAGLEVSRIVVQAILLVILLLNRELVVQRVFPAFHIQTRHPLFRPLIPLPGGKEPGAG